MSLSPQNFSDKESGNYTDNTTDNNHNAMKASGISSSRSDEVLSSELGSSQADERFGELIGHTIGPYLVEVRLGPGAKACGGAQSVAAWR